MPEPILDPHSRNLRRHRQMEGPGTFFVTKCLHPRKAVIGDGIASEIGSVFSFYADLKCGFDFGLAGARPSSRTI